ncbi:MAG: transglycosylase domain-containing protein [Candidatus Shapirobacteria bacterium]|nr:transglycosylase domain-containing protein [Candidatus Shapirobacteria bacterium]MDD5073860.1 transglycosylase domain-containing protein [Candidatus Shapirobacteria bacterium]MDD5481737.1 transglycosylase domain-containing protein [Candidatus Shapirobacteria bacterium]
MTNLRGQVVSFFLNFFIFLGRPFLLLIKLLLQVFLKLFFFGKLVIKASLWSFKWGLVGLKKFWTAFFKQAIRLKRAVFAKKDLALFNHPKVRGLSLRISPKLLFCLLLLLLIVYFGWLVFKDLPQPQKLITRDIKQTTMIYDRNGNLLYKIFRHQNRTLIPLEEVPQVVKEATIAIEDGGFYQHRGISFSGIARSFWRLIAYGRVEGGSTITQQLVKNALLSSERTMMRKVKEIVLALMVEARFSKEEILQMYLNEVGYGGAAYGIEEASQYYFGRSVRSLNLSEASFLAGLPASPTTYSPFGAWPQLAKTRQNEVLTQMEKKGFISSEAAQRARNAELRLRNINQDILAPHFVMQVKQELVNTFGDRFVEEGGLRVTTTLDLATQQLSERVVREELDKLVSFEVTNGAVLVNNPKTGEILAMVGSRDYFDLENSGNFNVTTAPRQPGSTIKVVNYALALQNGYTLASQILDAPVSFQISGQPPYRPNNYDNRFHGLMTLRTALACSYNVPAVKVLATLGVDRMVQLGRQMGIGGWTDSHQFGLSLTLGGGEVTMMELATVYGVLANGGIKIPSQTIIEIRDHKGKLIWVNPCLEEVKTDSYAFAIQTKVNRDSCGEMAVSPQVAWLLTSVLSDNQARSPVFGANSVINIPGYQVAVKTGTTNNLRDNWTIGYSPDLLVAAWVGNNDNSPMAQIASGVTGASPIWRRIMEALLIQEDSKEFLVPEGIVSRQICLSWDEEKQICQQSREEYFIADEEKVSGFGQMIETDSREKLLPARQDSR